MSNGQNTGRRYIPKFFTYNGSTEWRPNIAYSAKTIVTRNFKIYTSIVNVPSNIGSPEDNPKYWQPAVINDEAMQTIIEELGKLDGDASSFEHRLEVIENKVGELEVVIGEVQDDVDQLKNALTVIEIVDTASGAIASFPDGSDGLPVKELTVSIEPIQAGSGDPSPDNVRPISGRTGVTVTRTGFNVWDEEWEEGSIHGGNGQNVENNTKIRSKGYISVLPNTNYYFEHSAVAVGGADLFMYGKDKNYLGYTNYGVNEAKQFTTPANAYYMRFVILGTTYNNDISINYPSTDHDYHAYQGQTVTLQLGQTVYGGTLDVTTGVLTVDMALVDLGALNWSYITDFTYPAFRAYGSNAPTGIKENSAMTCTAYKFVGNFASWDAISQEGNCVIGGVTSAKGFVIRDDAYTDATTFKASVTGQTLAYELAAPITVQLTPQQLTTLLGQNNVWSDADSVSVDYVADTKLYIAKVIADALS